MEGRSVAVRPIPGTKDIMKNLRILLLATTALTASQLATSESQAQTAPIVMAQAKDEGPPGAKKEAPKGAPPPAAAPKAPVAGLASLRSLASFSAKPCLAGRARNAP